MADPHTDLSKVNPVRSEMLYRPADEIGNPRLQTAKLLLGALTLFGDLTYHCNTYATQAVQVVRAVTTAGCYQQRQVLLRKKSIEQGRLAAMTAS